MRILLTLATFALIPAGLLPFGAIALGLWGVFAEGEMELGSAIVALGFLAAAGWLATLRDLRARIDEC